MEKKTVLLVEDEQPLLKAARQKMEKDGFTVVTASSVDEAKNQMREHAEIDAVWIDHYLLGPGSGLDFLAYIKTSKQWQSIPVIVVSNYDDPEKQYAYFWLGAERYFVKAEHSLEEIINAVKESLEKEAAA